MYRLVVFFFLLTIVSCQSETYRTKGVSSEGLVQQLAVLNDSVEQNSKTDKTAFWSAKLKEKDFAQNGPSLAFIHYQIAKNLAKSNTAKAKHHINIALDLIEKEKAFNELKFTIYNGAGLIAESEEKFYQAVYYFNRSAAIIMNDDSLKSKPKAKVICLLNAAQDNNKIRQYPKAIQQSKRALKILPAMTEGSDKYYFRAYSQLFTSYIESRNFDNDSLFVYLGELKKIAERTQDVIQLRFTNEHFGQFYTLAGKYEEAIRYYQQVLDYDRQSLAAEPQRISAAKNKYITISNLIDLYVLVKRLPEAGKLINEVADVERKYGNEFSFYEKSLNKKAGMDYHFAVGNYQKAQKEADELAELKDNILKNSGIQATEEMTTIFQLQSKDRSIQSLNKTIDFTTERLEKNKLLMLISGLLALLAVSWALMFYFIQKQKRQKQEKEKIQLQQQLLRTQMEPHFIFNTLSALQSFIRFDEKEKSIKYLSQFSKLLRSSLELSRQSYVPLDEELEAIENYLSLQQMRFEHSFNYEIINRETDAETTLIPPMLIQPFVENAIIHGIGSQSDKGKIVLEIIPDENYLAVKISDNGKGYGNTEKANASHQSLSGTIAKERLEVLAKENKVKSNIEINASDNGTHVLLTIPVRYLS